MKRLCLIICVAICAFPFSHDSAASDSTCRDNSDRGHPATWMDSIQIYSYVATSIGNARRLNLTVNGVWNGCATENTAVSLLPETFLWRFRSDKAFVDNTHRAGMRHMSAIRCAFAHAQSFQEWPQLEEGVCRGLSGTFLKIPSWYIGNPCFMCQNSPVWQEYLLRLARRALDSGTDAILLDEPFGDTYFSRMPDPDVPGYSDWDLELLARDLSDSFDPHQVQTIFGLSKIELTSIRDKLKQVDFEKWAANPAPPDTTPADRLWLRLRRSQLKTNLEAKRKFVDGIRQYSRHVRGREVPVGANLAGLGSATFDSGTIPVLLLADLFDFVAFEMAYPPIGAVSKGSLPFSIPPRAKWMPWYKLGSAMWGPHRVLVLPSEGPFMEWITGDRRVNYLCLLLAEAYAGQGALLVPPVEELSKEPVERYTKFIKRNAGFYQGYDDVAPIGILYSYSPDNESRQWSYWGLAQALYESGIPFSTVFTTSEKSRWQDLSLESLKKHSAVFLPMGDALTADQHEMIDTYVRECGGTVILTGPGGGFSVPAEGGSHRYGAGRFVVMGGDHDASRAPQCDPAAAYWTSYSDEYRAAIVDTAVACLKEGSPVIIPREQREWSTVAYAQPDSNRVIIHVLNYDYDSGRDDFRPKENVLVRLDPSAFRLKKGKYYCAAYSPDREGPVDLACSQAGRYVEIELPRLYISEVIVLRPQEESSP
jgi:hypothetical protein